MRAATWTQGGQYIRTVYLMQWKVPCISRLHARTLQTYHSTRIREQLSKCSVIHTHTRPFALPTAFSQQPRALGPAAAAHTLPARQTDGQPTGGRQPTASPQSDGSQTAARQPATLLHTTILKISSSLISHAAGSAAVSSPQATPIFVPQILLGLRLCFPGKNHPPRQPLSAQGTRRLLLILIASRPAVLRCHRRSRPTDRTRPGKSHLFTGSPIAVVNLRNLCTRQGLVRG
jgi:hypothetical protein